MLKVFEGIRSFLEAMANLPSCCLLTSIFIILFALMATLDIHHVDAATTSATTTTTSVPFIESSMFIGLAAGIGGFLGFVMLCCLVWKCCCGTKDD